MEPINALHFEGGTSNFVVDRYPHVCPFCHKSITARRHGAFWKNGLLEILFGCPDEDCGRIFLSQYMSIGGNLKYVSSTIGTFKDRDFTENICNVSKDFTEIYNQAFKAESLNLLHIAGIGYRKALEFLVKDYLISKQPDKAEIISKKLLGKCIKDHVENGNLRDIAERAVWLGNDETHYVRKWVDRDVQDLKKLIDVSLHWIEMELLTNQYKSEMTSDN